MDNPQPTYVMTSRPIRCTLGIYEETVGLVSVCYNVFSFLFFLKYHCHYTSYDSKSLTQYRLIFILAKLSSVLEPPLFIKFLHHSLVIRMVCIMSTSSRGIFSGVMKLGHFTRLAPFTLALTGMEFASLQRPCVAQLHSFVRLWNNSLKLKWHSISTQNMKIFLEKSLFSKLSFFSFHSFLFFSESVLVLHPILLFNVRCCASCSPTSLIWKPSF